MQQVDLADEELTPWTTDELRSVEASVGKLPEAYENFVLTIGTGDLLPHLLPGKGVLVDTLNSPFSVANRSSGFDAWIPKEYVPVISAGGGGALAIRRDTGEVYFANYDQAVDLGLEEPSDEIMSKYADTWDALVAEMPSWQPLSDDE
jgi:hypothetical protein